ncbi:DUF6069 family protein [Actinoplanes sp. TFC3]|uniref:DUF6069 family protein n=1 Tax=Actinoplanes sp. TFC3 TaxID=1710355 RepID=UPI00082D3525|nr:DUF6069 family protein [Actinoplanes sp. TFC3]
MSETGVVNEPASGRARPPCGRLAVAGLIATLVAMVATTGAAALAKAAGAGFGIPDGAESIPLPGFAVVTGFCCLAGTAIALALLRWSDRPAQRFVGTAVPLTVLSLIPPLLSGGNAVTIVALVGLHLVSAAVMIPALARNLRTRST